MTWKSASSCGRRDCVRVFCWITSCAGALGLL